MGGRIGGPKTRNGGTWTEARFKGFVMSALRRTTMRWGPIATCLKRARTGRNEYTCAECRTTVPSTIKVDGRRVKFIHVDHIQPIIDPEIGFEGWDVLVDRLFCEADNLQALCGTCHEEKTNNEKAIAKARRERLKEVDELSDI